MRMIQRTLVLSFLLVAIGLSFDDGGNEQDFKGTIQTLPATGVFGDWMVSGATVHVTASTQVRQDDGPIIVGACVEVKGQPLLDASVMASEVRTQKASDCGAVQVNQAVDLTAVVQTVPMAGGIGDWVVGGRTVHVTSATLMKPQQASGPIAAGTCVEVRGQLNADSSITAAEIDGEPNSACGLVSGTPVDFQGTVQKLPSSGLAGDWVVDTRTVHVSASTDIEQEHGPAAVGACVEVKGEAITDGSVNATEIDIRSSSAGCGNPPPPQPQQELVGLVQMLPASGLAGDWQVSGRAVHVAMSTLIEQDNGVIAAGACVDVHGTVLTDNSINASEIDTRPASACAAAIGGAIVDFDGTVGMLPASGVLGDWQVTGRTVHVLPGTSISTNSAASFAVGQCVEVKGQMLADQTVDAFSIAQQPDTACMAAPPAPEVEVMGLVEKLPTGASLVGDWQVSGRTIHVLPGTQVDQEDGAVALGSCVEVKGTLASDQSLNATRVEVESVSGTCISAPGVVDAASLSPGMVSPGEIISLFGLRMGPPGLAMLQLTPDGKVATSLEGVRVLFDGHAAPLLAVTDHQVNAVVPFSVAGQAATQIQVEDGGAWSNPVSVSVAAAHPALFTIDGSGRNQAAILNQDGSVNSASQPASRGSIVAMFATGFGMADRKVEDGEVIADDQVKTAMPVTVQIGGMDADLKFAGMAPQMVAGVIQVNVLIPMSAPTGSAVAVQVKVGEFTTPAQVTLAIR